MKYRLIAFLFILNFISLTLVSAQEQNNEESLLDTILNFFEGLFSNESNDFVGRNEELVLGNEELFIEYRVRLTGNESIIFDTPRVREDRNGNFNLTLRIRNITERTINECIERRGCRNVTYQVPTLLPMRERNGTIVRTETISDGAREFSVTFERGTRYLRFGTSSVVVLASNSYNSTNSQVTNSSGYAHLTLNESQKVIAYYNFDTNETFLEDFSTLKNTMYCADEGEEAPCGTMNTSAIRGNMVSFTPEVLHHYIQDNWGGFGGNYTVSFWIRSNSSGLAEVLSTYEGFSTNSFVVRVPDSLNQFGFFGIFISPINATTNHNIRWSTSGTWQHIAVTRSTNGSFIVYMNGSIGVDLFAGTPSAYNDPSGMISYPTNNFLKLGVQLNNTDIDELIIFNRTLTGSEILQLYRNNTAIFNYTGTMNFTNKNLSGTGTENRVNISILNTSQLFRSNLSVSADGGVTWTLINSTTNEATNVSLTSPNNANITFRFNAGNSSANPFYTPVIIGNITLNSYFAGGGTDSCTYTSGNWNVVCNDNCIINSNVSLNPRSNISLTGSGTFTINNGIKIRNFSYLKSDRACYIKGIGSGGFINYE